MKRCAICKLEKEGSEFGKNKTTADGLQTYCVLCGKEKDRRYYQKNKTKVNLKRNLITNSIRNTVYAYLQEHPCVDCGESDPVVLEFDHVRGKKLNTVSNLIGQRRSLKIITEEIRKCDVRCSNCHKRKTAKQQGWYASVAQFGQST